MTAVSPYLWAEIEIEKARQQGATSLDLNRLERADHDELPLEELPHTLRKLTHLKSLTVSFNSLRSSPLRSV